MANEEKYRVETPEEEEKPEEKKGLLKPLPTREEPQYIDKDGRPQPIVKVLGVSMPEKRKDLLMMTLIPALVGLIDTTLYSFIITGTFESSATYLFFIPIIIAIPIGLTAAEAGRALVSSLFGAIFFMIFFIIFLASPGLYVPELGIASFLLSALTLSIAYFILIIVSTFLGTVVGVIIREFF